jgi:hypothetical protein
VKEKEASKRMNLLVQQYEMLEEEKEKIPVNVLRLDEYLESPELNAYLFLFYIK